MTGKTVALVIAIMIVTWHVLASLIGVVFLPSPLAVVSALPREMTGSLGKHFLVSGWRVLVSIMLAVTIAAPLGLILGQSKRLDHLLMPFVYLTYPIPKIVFLPIVLLFLGIGDASKIFIITFIVFYQVLVVVRDAASGIRPELLLSVRSLGAKRWQLLRYAYGPACLPAILTALRISTGTAIAVLFVAESFATSAGLGYYILIETWGRMAYAEMYGGVIAMGSLGFMIYLALDQIEKRLCPWARLALPSQ